MVDSNALLALAERAEKASAPDREVDRLIAAEDGFTVVDERHPLGWCCYDKRGISVPLPRYTASLDAAMSLVPEKHGQRLWIPDNRQSGDENRPRATIWGTNQSYAPRDAIAATPALALTAAALRALANQKDN